MSRSPNPTKLREYFLDECEGNINTLMRVVSRFPEYTASDYVETYQREFRNDIIIQLDDLIKNDADRFSLQAAATLRDKILSERNGIMEDIGDGLINRGAYDDIQDALHSVLIGLLENLDDDQA